MSFNDSKNKRWKRVEEVRLHGENSNTCIYCPSDLGAFDWLICADCRRLQLESNVHIIQQRLRDRAVSNG